MVLGGWVVPRAETVGADVAVLVFGNQRHRAIEACIFEHVLNDGVLTAETVRVIVILVSHSVDGFFGLYWVALEYDLNPFLSSSLFMIGSLVGCSHVFVLGFKQLLQQLEVHPALEKV